MKAYLLSCPVSVTRRVKDTLATAGAVLGHQLSRTGDKVRVLYRSEQPPESIRSLLMGPIGQEVSKLAFEPARYGVSLSERYSRMCVLSTESAEDAEDYADFLRRSLRADVRIVVSDPLGYVAGTYLPKEAEADAETQ